MQKQFSQFNRFNPSSLSSLRALAQYLNLHEWLCHQCDEAESITEKESWATALSRHYMAGVESGLNEIHQGYLRAV